MIHRVRERGIGLFGRDALLSIAHRHASQKFARDPLLPFQLLASLVDPSQALSLLPINLAL